MNTRSSLTAGCGIALEVVACRAANLDSTWEGDMKVETDVKAGGAIWGGRENHNETIVG